MKIVVADPKVGKNFQVEIEEEKAKPLHGLKIGDSVSGDLFGLAGYKLEITGGSDKDGFPMRFDVHGTERKRLLLSSGPGIKTTEKGERRKKTVRGNTISQDIVQLNLKIVEYGQKPVAELFPAAAPKEEKAEKEAA